MLGNEREVNSGKISLRERQLREMKCKHLVACILQDTGLGLLDKLKKIVQDLPQACSYPEAAQARAVVGGMVCCSSGSHEKASIVLQSEIVADGEDLGFVEISYKDCAALPDGTAFLSEERCFLDAVADQLGAFPQIRQRHGGVGGEAAAFWFSFVHTPLVAVDKDLRIVAVNPSFCEFAGCGIDVVGRMLDSFVPDGQKKFCRLHLEKAVEGGNPINFEMPIIHKSGEVRLAVWNSTASNLPASSVPQAPGQPDLAGKLWIFQGRDITAGRLAAEELRQARKLAEVGRLASGIAHDFNNILTGICGYAGLLRSAFPEGSTYQRHVDSIYDASRHGARIVRQLLQFTRKTPPEMQLLDLNSIVASAADLLQHSIPSNIKVVFTPCPGEAVVRGDVAEVQRMLLNLGANAKDAMPDGGRIAIATTRLALRKGDALVDRLSLGLGEYIEISVTDTGRGMDDETQARIFEAFFTTKDHESGTGLGLGSVKGCALLHHGAVDVESKLGCGARFSIYLPAAEEKLPAKAAKLASLETRGEGMVLVVDDDDMVREVSELVLKRLGYETKSFPSGDSSLDWYKENYPSVDLVLLDIEMPGSDGFETAKALKFVDPQAKILLLTGHAMRYEGRRLEQLGVVGMLAKPFEMAELAERVSATVGEQPRSKAHAVPSTPALGTASASKAGVRSIIVIDGDRKSGLDLAAQLQGQGCKVALASTGGEGVALAGKERECVVVADYCLPDIQGGELLRAIRTANPKAEIVAMAATASVNTLVDALNLGAGDFLLKPLNAGHLLLVAEKLLSRGRHGLIGGADAAEGRSSMVRGGLGRLVGCSPQMNRVYRQLEKCVEGNGSVLLHGEVGTGKRLAASVIHMLSARRERPYVAVDCHGVQPAGQLAEIFNLDERVDGRPSCLQLAANGTLLLANVESLSPQAQGMLLSLVENNASAVGAGQAARIIATTEADLEALAERGLFDEKLCFRLLCNLIEMPALRDRPEDIPLLATHFLERLRSGGRLAPAAFSPKCLAILSRHAWPKNAGELEALVGTVAAGCHGELARPANLPRDFLLREQEESPVPTLDEGERSLLVVALRRCGGSKAEMARVLGVSRNTVYALMRKHGIGEG